MTRKIFICVSIFVLLCLASVGWAVFFTQNPLILAKARLRYIQAVKNHTKLDNGPCLGSIDKDWVLDIAHIPRVPLDDLPQNQCHNFRHFVEMSPKGEIILVS